MRELAERDSEIPAATGAVQGQRDFTFGHGLRARRISLRRHALRLLA